MAFDREIRVGRTGSLGGQSALMLGALVLVALLLFASLKYVPAGRCASWTRRRATPSALDGALERGDDALVFVDDLAFEE